MKNVTSKLVQAMSIGMLVAIPAMVSAKSINMAYTQTPDSQHGAAGKAFKETLETLSKGKFKVNLKPGGVMGGERVTVESIQKNMPTVQMTITSTGPYGNFDKHFFVFDFPYIFDSYEHAYKVLDSDIGMNVLKGLEKNGIKALAWGDNGLRNATYNGSPILAPRDLKGRKIRTMQNRVHIETFKALGASPTPMGWPEVYSALQAGQIDGQENPINLAITSRLYEVQNQASMTNHFYSPAVIAMSKKYFDRLKPQEKEWVQEAAKVAGATMRETRAQLEAEAIIALEAKGMKIHDVDMKPFESAVQSFRTTLATKLGEELAEETNDSADKTFYTDTLKKISEMR